MIYGKQINNLLEQADTVGDNRIKLELLKEACLLNLKHCSLLAAFTFTIIMIVMATVPANQDPGSFHISVILTLTLWFVFTCFKSILKIQKKINELSA